MPFDPTTYSNSGAYRDIAAFQNMAQTKRQYEDARFNRQLTLGALDYEAKGGDPQEFIRAKLAEREQQLYGGVFGRLFGLPDTRPESDIERMLVNEAAYKRRLDIREEKQDLEFNSKPSRALLESTMPKRTATPPAPAAGQPSAQAETQQGDPMELARQAAEFLAPEPEKTLGLSFKQKSKGPSLTTLGTSFKQKPKGPSLTETASMGVAGVKTRQKSTGKKTKSKQLDRDTAMRFLQEAGCDKDKARKLAKDAGYTF